MNLNNAFVKQITFQLFVFSLLFSLMPFVRLLIGGQLPYITEAINLAVDFLQRGGHFADVKHHLVLAFKHRPIYLFLLWNLFLAWLPLYFSFNLVHIHEKHKAEGKPLNGIALFSFWLQALLWLLFFPNAPYIVTDFFHLQVKSINHIPLWYDLIMLTSFSCLGFALGFVSLWQVQSLVAHKWGKKIAMLFVNIVLLLSAFGIYLGRFVRLNSWDFFTNPVKLIGEVLNALTSFDCLGFTFMMFIFLSCFYTLLLSYTLMIRISPKEMMQCPPKKK